MREHEEQKVAADLVNHQLFERLYTSMDAYVVH
jgi:hypothetical protein